MLPNPQSILVWRQCEEHVDSGLWTRLLVWGAFRGRRIPIGPTVLLGSDCTERNITVRFKNERIFVVSKKLRKGQLHETVMLRFKICDIQIFNEIYVGDWLLWLQLLGSNHVDLNRGLCYQCDASRVRWCRTCPWWVPSSGESTSREAVLWKNAV